MELRFAKIKTEVGEGGPFLKPLQRVTTAGEDIRRERNLRAHQGLQRAVAEEPFFKLLSMTEATQSAGPRLSAWRFTGAGDLAEESNSDNYDLKAKYAEIMQGLADEFLPACHSLVEDVGIFLEELYSDFDARCAAFGLP